ncbi:MAG: hypothetical protein ABW034_13125, partial [Steroidobacteraceae bacterium]
VVDAADLLGTACQLALQLADGIARTAQGSAASPYDFSRDDVFDLIAADCGLSAEDRLRYPAYDAIMSCVVGGWSQPIAAACDWEMKCFVGLIRDPVAGNMVRSLFLDRQRAAKLLAKAARPTSEIAVAGEVSEALAATLKKARIGIVEPGQLPEAGIVLRTSPGAAPEPQLVELGWLRTLPSSDAGVWLSDTTNHGRALEICVPAADSRAEHAGLALARALRAAPLVMHGPSLLASLHAAQTETATLTADLQVLAVALAAARVWQVGGVEDAALADSAAVIGGLHPAYTGGPFCYLRQRPLSTIRAAAARAAVTHPEQFALPRDIERLCADSADVSLAAPMAATRHL